MSYPAWLPGRLTMALVVLAILLSSCGLIPDAARPTKTPVPTPTTTPTIEPDEEGDPAATPVAQITRVRPTLAAPAQAAAQYDLVIELNYDLRQASVHQTIRGINPAGEELGELILVIEANRLEGVFSLGAVRVGAGAPLENLALDGTLLRVPLQPALAKDAGFTLELTYSLQLPLTYGWLSYTGKQLNLGDWYPFIPVYQPGSGFLVHNPGVSGEYLVYPRIDYTVELNLAESSAPLIVAASAPPEPSESSDARSYHYTFAGGRGFAFSISPDFLVKSLGVVDIYYYAGHEASADASLRVANDALELYSELFAPYPFARLAVVEADFFDGMEYTGLFFLGAEYFAAYPNSPQSYLTALSAHETAHQWWYGLVGNDPALEPWLDEAFSTYSEVFYYEKFEPDLVRWWWNYRVDRFDPSGAVNSTIYAFDGFRPYVNSVYLNGARFLQEVRDSIGEDAFLALLQDIAAQQSELITDDLILGWLRDEGGTEMNEIIARYFERK